MGAMQNNLQADKTKRGKRGSVNNGSRLAAFSRSQGGGDADWGSCLPEDVLGVIVKITALGGAVTFGMSRNKGAYSLTLLLDQERETLWFNGGADLSDELAGVMATLDAMS